MGLVIRKKCVEGRMALKYCGTAVMLRYCSTRSVKKVKPGWDPALFNPAQSLPTDSALNCRRRRVSDERDHPKRNGVHNLAHHGPPCGRRPGVHGPANDRA